MRLMRNYNLMDTFLRTCCQMSIIEETEKYKARQKRNEIISKWFIKVDGQVILRLLVII